MAFCTNCGAQVPDGTKFCTSCGTKIEQQAAAPAQEAPRQEAPRQEAPRQEAPAEQPVNRPQEAAPVQGSYTPPTQQSYQAPQQEYSAQPAYAPAAKAPKQKKPMDKKTLFIIGGAALAVILAVVLIVVLAGKGGKTPASADPNLGVYDASTAEMWGIEMAISDLWENGFSIELKDNGKCTLEVDGAKSNGKWTLEDGVFHVSGGGVDCDGTLQNGVMTLEDVLGMGVTLTFEKEGGVTAPDADPNGGAVTAASDIQKQWNGTWYGAMYVSEATGAYADVACGFYDAYMVVDVDAEGNGTFAVYLAGAEDAFALANCEAKESGLYAVDGTIAGGAEMYAYNWMFLPMPDYPDQYTMSDEIANGDDLFTFALFMKQWGGSWQKEIDSDFAIVPPSVDAYNAAIANGELPPVGVAPIGYEGTAASGNENANPSGGDESNTGAPDASAYDTSGFNGVLDLEGKGLVELNYPDDMFEQDSECYTIKCSDKRIYFTTIYVYPQGSSSIDGSNDFMSGLSTCVDFEDTQVTIGGYPARRVTCIDDFYSEPFAYYLIDTSSANNPDAGAVYIKVNLKEAEDYPLVDAIVGTLKLK